MTSAENRLTPIPIDQTLGLCDLISLAFRIWRKNLKLIFKALITPTVLYFVSVSVLQWCVSYGFKAGFGMAAVSIGLVIVSALVYLFALIFMALRQIALLRYLTGFSSTWEKAEAFARSRWLWLLGLTGVTVTVSGVLIGVWVCVMVLSAVVSAKSAAIGSIFAAVGIFIGMIGFFISLMFLGLLSVMGFSVLSCEEDSFFGLIGRTFHWTFKYFGRVMAFSCVFYIVFSIVTVPVSIPVVFASVADVAIRQAQGTYSSDSELSLGVLIFVQAWEAVTGLLLRPVTLLCFGLFYLDLRQRAEGLDIVRRLNLLKAAQGAENEPSGR